MMATSDPLPPDLVMLLRRVEADGTDVGLAREARDLCASLARTGRKTPDAARSSAESFLRRCRFMKRLGARDHNFYSRRNWLALLKATGADKRRIGIVLDSFFIDWGMLTPRLFDHNWLFGRGRTPIVAVSCPYQIPDDERPVIEALRGLGAFVRVVEPDPERPSLYGHGTYQVEVWGTDPAEAFA